MAKVKGTDTSYGKGRKKTSIGSNNIKTSSMNKSKKRGYKSYRGQGK
jgi:hypothetical protein